MTNQEKLEGFISDLNLMLDDWILFSEKRQGRFSFNVKKRLGYNEIFIEFNEKDLNHVVFYKRWDVSDRDFEDNEELFGIAYYEFLRTGILGSDSVGKMKDAIYGNSINVLNFATLLTTGLDKLRNGQD